MAVDGGRVLIVEDEPDMRRLLQQVLVPPHDVVSAPDGMVACAKLETGRFDVVLTDVRIPGPNGFELARLIMKKWPLTEVVLMTAFGSIEAAVEAVRLGAYDYIPKPFTADDLKLVITRALARRRERARIEDPVAAAAQLATYSYREALAEVRDNASRGYLAALLKMFAGNVARAAEHAGLERESFHRLLRRYGIHADDFRDADPQPGALKTRGSES